MSDETLRIIRRLDPDGWEEKEPTDHDRARFRREVIIRFGANVWARYSTDWDQPTD